VRLVGHFHNFLGTTHQNPVTSGEQIREQPITTESVFNLGVHLPFSAVILTILAPMPCIFLFVFGATAPQWAMASSFTGFLDHTTTQ